MLCLAVSFALFGFGKYSRQLLLFFFYPNCKKEDSKKQAVNYLNISILSIFSHSLFFFVKKQTFEFEKKKNPKNKYKVNQ